MTITNASFEFLNCEYSALREEIIELKARVRKEFVIGLMGVPLLVGFAAKFSLTELLLVTPIVVISGSLMLLFEQLSIMRAGYYIRTVIEKLNKNDVDIGWESWLERPGVARDPSKYFRLATATTFLIYYVFCCLVAIASSVHAYSLLAAALITVFYILGLAYFSFLLLKNYMTHADLRKDPASSTTATPDQQCSVVEEKDKFFLLAEFRSLRSEILGLKNRVVKETTLGLTGIPILLGGVTLNQELRFLLALGPVIIAAVGLNLVFEHKSLMRAGMYIKNVIEPRITGNSFDGWETFLEKHPDARNAERYFRWSSMLAVGLYYFIGTKLAADAFSGYTGGSSFYAYVFYFVIFPLMLWTLWKLPLAKIAAFADKVLMHFRAK